jgi:hypothetical protein
VHDFNPGIKPSGLFWTIPVDAGTIDANTGTGAARFAMANLAIPDYHDFFNSISPSPTWVPAHASFEVVWQGGGERVKLRDGDFGFGGQYVGGPATVTFAASVDGEPTVYSSDADGQRNPDDAPPGVGHERNGMFFDHDA